MPRHAFSLLTLIPLAALIGAAAGWLAARESAKSPTLLEQLRAMDIAMRNDAFADWRRRHPDIPRTIEFPEVATNPVLWDFTKHAVLHGLKRMWTWGEMHYATSATATIISTPMGGGMWAACSQYPGYYQGITISTVPARSGGYP